MKRLSVGDRKKIVAYAKENGCKAYEIKLTVRFVSEDTMEDIEKLAGVVSNHFNPGGREALGFPIKTKRVRGKTRGKFARLPGYIEAGEIFEREMSFEPEQSRYGEEDDE